MPPYLAGRDASMAEFDRYLRQETVQTNVVITGLRGVGKTVLLDRLKPRSQQAGWAWVGSDLSEAASVSERNLATRILADLAPVSSFLTVPVDADPGLGFSREPRGGQIDVPLGYSALEHVFEHTPGLVADKLKAVLELVWSSFSTTSKRGIVFAYDEAQNLADHAQKNEFPMSLLLDVFQSIQKKGVRFMLVLTGLPTLLPKLVDVRTYSERMFHTIVLDRLSEEESRDAILRPVKNRPITFAKDSVATIIRLSGGYPFFIQFFCREAYDIFVQGWGKGPLPIAPLDGLIRKLDTDFFAPRWQLLTDREQDLLRQVASLDTCADEFTIQELTGARPSDGSRPFTSSHANQLLLALCRKGAVYKTRFGKYCFAVPLFWEFVRRQARPNASPA
ncbi:MAG: ATP-binding protein [Planctomycetes bacterium]|nr:ATP-binding protein [Planctomycetota bacterium]MCB9825255.1 ATP-binding protein [Planctomycetota bacterium]MCB9828807.1 ATP-binding protein [Planctomycetota bacterium]